MAATGLGPLAGPARFMVYGAAVGEVIADKLPQMPSRWSRRGLTLRVGFSSIGGGRQAQFAAAVFEDSLSYALAFGAMRGRDRDRD